MGYLIPGNKFARYGDHLLNADSNGGVSSLPDIRPGIMPLNKTAALRSATAFAGADISRSAPTFNDPRYSFTTLSIPTDLRTLNGLYRFFDDTDPVVGNSLRLHVEFPLSRVSLKQLPDPVIQRHYEEMCSKINFEKLLFDIGLEYWRIGNVFTFGAWNTAEHMWDQFVILNPDYVTVESTYLNQRPLIKLQPDEHLKKVVSTGQPKFLYDQLPKEIIKYVRMGQEIPLSPNNTFHISHNRAPYETLGRSIIKRILKTLIYEDRMSMANFAIATRQVIPLTVVKLGDANSGWIPSNEEIDSWKEIMACHDDQTEIMTESGFKLFKDLSHSDRVACFNPANNQLEYHLPTAYQEYDYNGQMIHFSSDRKIDILVTPNHNMWVGEYDNPETGKWKKVRADQVTRDMRFRSVTDWKGVVPPETLIICDKEVKTKTYLKFLGWFLSEGSVSYGVTKYHSKKLNKEIEYKNARIQIAQRAGLGSDDITQTLDDLGFEYNKHEYVTANDTKYNKFNITREFGKFIFDQFEGGCTTKYIPREILSYDKEHLQIILDSLMQGDGDIKKYKNGDIGYTYTTTSKQLADDVYEIAWKLGFAPILSPKKARGENHNDFYYVRFTTSRVGEYPMLYHKVKIDKADYNGKVYCVTVPTGVIFTRRNGKGTIQAQSREIDPNFSVVYHWGVDVQFYGASSRIWNLTAEFNRVMKWKLIGLGISEGLLTGGSSYATAYAQLEVLRQRYLHFQHMLGHFVYKGIFEPVAQQCGFYKTSALTSGPGYIGRKFGNTKDGFKDPLSGDEIEKHASEFNNPLTAKYLDHLQKQSHVTDTQYVYPELDWDLLSLGNDVQYRNFLMNFDKLFPGVRKISDTTFYRAAKLDPETEQANLLREYQTEMEQKLEKGKLEKKYRQEFEKEGIPFPGMMGAPPPGQPGAPGPGGTPGPGGMLVPPGAPPPMGGTGGGNLPGTPAMTPNSPLGQNQFQGMAPGRPGAPPNPAASRVQSLELQRRLTSSFAEIESENDLEAAQLKISNQEAGILSVEDEDAEL